MGGIPDKFVLLCHKCTWISVEYPKTIPRIYKLASKNPEKALRLRDKYYLKSKKKASGA